MTWYNLIGISNTRKWQGQRGSVHHAIGDVVSEWFCGNEQSASFEAAALSMKHQCDIEIHEHRSPRDGEHKVPVLHIVRYAKPTTEHANTA